MPSNLHARDVGSFTCGLHTAQLSGVFVYRRDIFSPGSDFLHPAPDLALIDNDSIIGEQRDECVEVASSLGGKVTGDDVRGRDSQDSSFQQRPRSRGQARDVHPW